MKALRNLLVVPLLLTSIFSFSQDVGLPQMTYPIPNQRVHLQYTYDVSFIIKNYGGGAVPANSGINFNLLYDGVSQGIFLFNPQPKINVGDSLEISINGRSFSTPNSTLDVCVVLDYSGDISKNNDTICNLLRFSVDNNYDIGPSFIDITLPDVDSVIKPGAGIILAKVTMTNYGTVTIPENDKIQVEVTMYSNTNGPYQGTTTTAFDTGATFDITAAGLQPKVQTNPGLFQICAKLVNKTEDKNNSNDEYCQVFYAYDWTGVKELKENQIESYSFGKEVYLKNLDTESNVIRIFSTTGSLILEQTINSPDKEGVIDLSNLNHGIYIIQIFESGELVHANRFSID